MNLSATIKPELYASWIPIGKIIVKPDIFISWIPTGKILLSPKIFATYIPAPEKTSVDTSRIVSKSESISAYSIRRVTNSEKNSADLLRSVIDSETSSADTLRKIYQPENFSADSFRRVVQSDKTAADTFRQVNKLEIAIADTSRKNGLTIISADTKRNIISTIKNSVDTCRVLGEAQIVSADTYIKTARTDIAQADTFRKLLVATNANADTLRKIGVRETFAADTFLNFANREKSSADTLRQVTATEIATADLNRAIREIAGYDTFLKVTHKEKAIASTVIRVPHIWNYIVKPALRTAKLLADNQPSLVETFKAYGITAVDITLSERTLSDNFSFQITKPVNINDAVQGALLDYHFNFLVEETTQTDLIQDVKGRYSQDKSLYTWFLLKTPTYTFPADIFPDNASFPDISFLDGELAERVKDLRERKEKIRSQIGNNVNVEVYPKARELISNAAMALGLSLDDRFDDFTPSNVQGDEKITYHDLINSVFGWTSQVPQRQINVFIRGSTLHCIQRGYESSVFDISDLPHSRPTVNKKIIRTLCHNPNKSDDDDVNNDSNSDSDSDSDDNNYKFSGDITYKKDGIAPFQERIYLLLSYKDGLLQSESISTQTGMFANSDGEIVVLSNNSYTTYSYQDKFNQATKETEYYLSSKHQHTVTKEQNMETLEIYTTEQEATTTYGYSDDFNSESRTYETYLFHESEQSTKTEYQDGDQEEITSEIRDTYHVPVGNGWYAQTVYLNHILQGANLSQGKPDNSVSPYTIQQVQQNFKGYTLEYHLKRFEEKIEENKEEWEKRLEELKEEFAGLSKISDISFPVRDKLEKVILDEALYRLNGKIQETITLDLISPVNNGIPTINHIVDFTERIKFDGNEYFLVYNRITFNPRKLIQKLQLIRWY